MKHLKSTIVLILVFALLLTVSVPALAQGGARVYLQPVESTGQTLTVDVMLDNVTNLYGAEFRLKYDPAVLAVQDLNPQQEGIQIQAGAFLPSDNGKGFVVANKVDEAAGQIIFALTLLNPTPAVNGQGALARVTFKVLQNIPATINVEHAKLVAADLQTIPSETSALTIGQDNRAVAAPAPTAASGNFPWWIVAVLVLGLGVALLAGLIIMGAGRTRASATATPPQRPVKPQPAPVKSAAAQMSRRPSAFNQQPGDLKQKP